MVQDGKISQAFSPSVRTTTPGQGTHMKNSSNPACTHAQPSSLSLGGSRWSLPPRHRSFRRRNPWGVSLSSRTGALWTRSPPPPTPVAPLQRSTFLPHCSSAGSFPPKSPALSPRQPLPPGTTPEPVAYVRNQQPADKSVMTRGSKRTKCAKRNRNATLPASRSRQRAARRPQHCASPVRAQRSHVT